MRHITFYLDRIASRLECRGMFDEAERIDVISNTVEALSKSRKLHPESYKSVYDKLLKYKGDPDIFVSFTELPKLGLNPRTSYNTPAGVYAYPIDYVLDKKDVPFGRDRPYVQILRHTKSGKYINDISRLGRAEYVQIISNLKKMFVGPNAFFPDENSFLEYLKKTERLSNNSTDGGVLFYLIVRLSEDLPGKGTINQMKIWRSLGYTMIADRSGASIIHPAEPFQAVFLDKSAYVHIDTLINRTYNRYNLINNEKYLRDNIDYLEYTPGRIQKMIFNKHPDIVLDWIKDDYDNFYVLDQPVQAQLIKKYPDRFKVKLLEDEDYLRDNLHLVGRVPDEIMEQILDKYSHVFIEESKKDPLFLNDYFLPEDYMLVIRKIPDLLITFISKSTKNFFKEIKESTRIQLVKDYPDQIEKALKNIDDIANFQYFDKKFFEALSEVFGERLFKEIIDPDIISVIPDPEINIYLFKKFPHIFEDNYS